MGGLALEWRATPTGHVRALIYDQDIVVARSVRTYQSMDDAEGHLLDRFGGVLRDGGGKVTASRHVAANAWTCTLGMRHGHPVVQGLTTHDSHVQAKHTAEQILAWLIAESRRRL